MSRLISVDAALDLLHDNPVPKVAESKHIRDAIGRTLVRPIVAQVSQPPASMSAMDGYAVRLKDVTSPNARLSVIGSSAAGHPSAVKVTSGTAIRVFTGSVLPDGADHVILQENVETDGNEIIYMSADEQPLHVRQKALDFARGDTLVAPGERLSPAHLAIAAASNNPSVEVLKRPRVGILSNGDELREPGSTLMPGEIINSNPYNLAGWIEEWGGEPVDLGTASDSVESIQACATANEVDIYLPIGGASVGDHDHMHSAFMGLGFDTIFKKVAVRPGKPTWFAKKNKQCVLGLPGNPASALVCAHLFLAPLLGHNWESRVVRAQVVQDLSENGPREHFMRARAYLNGSSLEVRPASNQDSSMLRIFLSNNALIRRKPHAPEVFAGDEIDVLIMTSIV